MIVHTVAGRYEAQADGLTTEASSVEKEVAEWLILQRPLTSLGRLYHIDQMTKKVGRRAAPDELVDPALEYAYVTDKVD